MRGSRVSHASLLVTDASGREMRRVDRLDEVERYFASGVDRTAPAVISWDSTVDGKKLIRADDPFTIILTVYDTEGRRVEARTEAAR